MFFVIINIDVFPERAVKYFNYLQLLMVPTPFFVGVCTSFMRKVNEVHRSETWIVDLDNKEVWPYCHKHTVLCCI